MQAFVFNARVGAEKNACLFAREQEVAELSQRLQPNVCSANISRQLSRYLAGQRRVIAARHAEDAHAVAVVHFGLVVATQILRDARRARVMSQQQDDRRRNLQSVGDVPSDFRDN